MHSYAGAACNVIQFDLFSEFQLRTEAYPAIRFVLHPNQSHPARDRWMRGYLGCVGEVICVIRVYFFAVYFRGQRHLGSQSKVEPALSSPFAPICSYIMTPVEWIAFLARRVASFMFENRAVADIKSVEYGRLELS